MESLGHGCSYKQIVSEKQENWVYWRPLLIVSNSICIKGNGQDNKIGDKKEDKSMATA